MDKTALCTGYEFEFQDGEKCQMSLSFIRLKKLASKKKELYDRQQNIMIKGTKSELDVLTVLYTAYVCANMERDDLLTEDEFIERCGEDHVIIFEAFDALMNPKKRRASGDHSN